MFILLGLVLFLFFEIFLYNSYLNFVFKLLSGVITMFSFFPVYPQ